MSPLMLENLPNVHIETGTATFTAPEISWETVYPVHGAESFRFCRWRKPSGDQATSPPHLRVMLLIHGLGGKPEWMSAFASSLLEVAESQLDGLPLVIYAIDMPAYGAEKPGGEGHIQAYPQLLDRLDACWEWLQGQHPEACVLPVGLSLGGLVLTHWAARRLQAGTRHVALKQLALISPAFKASPVSFNPLFYAVVILRYCLERLCLLSPGALPLPYANEWTDPTVVKTMTVHGYWELLKMTLFETPKVLAKLSGHRLPIWLGVAETDTICDPAAMVNAYRQWPSEKKRLTLFPHAAHDLVLDPAMPAMAQDILHWWVGL